MGTGRRGRPERPLDTSVPALAELAHQLRGLRRTAGLTLDELSRATNWSKGALSAATTGRDLPRQELVEAWVRTCAPGANADLWQARYLRAREAYAQVHPGPIGPPPSGSALPTAPPTSQAALPESAMPSAQPPADDKGALWQDARRSLADDEQAWGPRAHPAPIPLRYTTVGADLTDAGPGSPDLRGTYDDIGEVFALSGSHRLVILGEKGSGKTELARHLGSLLLARADGVSGRGARTKTDQRTSTPRGTDSSDQDVTGAGARAGAGTAALTAVPVMASLGNWTTTDEPYGIAGWLAHRLTGTSADDVHALLTQRRLLPVLDDFDQLSPQARAHVLHALNQLPEQAPFVLVSGWKEFTETVESTDTVIPRSAGIRISRLDVADLDGWIQLTSRTVSKAAEWSQVLQTLRTDAEAPARELLSDPLFAGAARLLYSDGRADPGELVRDGVTAAALEARLIHRLLGTTAPPPRRTGDEPIKDAQLDKALRLVARATARHGGPVRTLSTLYVGARQRRRSAAAYSAALSLSDFLTGQAALGMLVVVGSYLYLRHRDLERPLLDHVQRGRPRPVRLGVLGGLIGSVLLASLLGAVSTRHWASISLAVLMPTGWCLLLTTVGGAWLRASIGSPLRVRDLDPPILKGALDLARRRGLLEWTPQGITFTHPAVARWYSHMPGSFRERERGRIL